MELETLRLTFQADTGSAAANLKTLEKMILAQVRAMNAATNASKEHETVAAKQVAVAMEVAAQAAKTSLAMTEQAKRTAASSAAFKSQVAQMKQSAEASARLSTTFRTSLKVQSETQSMTAKVMQMTNNYDRAMQVLNPTIAKTAAVTRDYDSSKKGLINTLFGAAQKAFFFGSVIGHVASTLKGAFTMMEEAARTNAAKKYFDDSGKSLEELRVAARGLVSDGDLIKKANLAEAMGLDNNTFKTLLATAQASAAKTGQSFDHMFDSIVVGTARSSRLLLDNLGIIVSIDQANRTYAEQFKKDARYQHMSIEQIVEAFTAEQKQIAFIEETARKAAPAIEQMNKLGETGAETYDRFSANIKNLAHNLGTEMGKVLQGLIGYMNTLLGQMNKFFDDRNSAASKMGMFDGYRGADVDAVMSDGRAGPGKSKSYNFAGGFNVAVPADILTPEGEQQFLFDAVSKRADDLAANFAQMADSLGVQLTAEEALVYSTQELRDGFGENAKGLTDLLKTYRALDGLLERDVARRRAAESSGVSPGAPGDLEGVKGDKAAEKAAEKEKDAKAKWTKQFYDNLMAAEQEAIKKDLKLQKEVADWEKQFFNELSVAELKALEEEAKARDKAAQEKAKYDEAVFEEEMRLLQSRADNLAKLDGALADLFKTAGGVATGQTGLGTAVGAAAGGALGAMAGAPQAGAALGELFGTMMDKLPGMQKISDAISGGFLNMFKLAFGPLLSVFAQMEQPIYTLLSALGVLGRSILAPFVVILQAVVPWMAMLINVVAAVVIGFSPLIGLVIALVQTFGMLAGYLFALFGGGLLLRMIGFEEGIYGMTDALLDGTTWMIKGFVRFHNSIISLIREIPGMSKYGKKIKYSDVLPPPPAPAEDPGADDPNTDALDENTRALRDLARELHNLPSGYKGNAAMYNASENEAGRTNRNVIRESAKDRTNNLMPRMLNPFR